MKNIIPYIFENHAPWIFKNHRPRLFENKCPKIFKIHGPWSFIRKLFTLNKKNKCFFNSGGVSQIRKIKISHKIYHLKKNQNIIPLIFKNFKIFQQKISQSKNFWKSMSQDFWKFMVHDFLKFNVPRFFATLAYLTA